MGATKRLGMVSSQKMKKEKGRMKNKKQDKSINKCHI